MTDDHLGLFGQGDEDTGNVDVQALRRALAEGAGEAPSAPVAPPTVSRRAAMRHRREVHRRRRRRKRRHTLIAIFVLLLLAGGLAGGWVWWRSTNVTTEFSGPPGPQTLIRIKSGDNRADMAERLKESGVISDAGIFVSLTDTDPDVQALQPGYFRVQTNLTAADAADQLVDPANRVGHLSLVPGRLADVTTTSNGGGITPGYVSQIAAAACVPLDGASHACPTAEQLWEVLRTADPVALGVPDWAVDGILAAPVADSRYEGILRPGEYDVPPNTTAQEVLQALMSASTAKWNSSDLVAESAIAGLTPYETIIIASIVEKESNAADMPKVARVIDNRRQIQMPLQMDSTVNYALGRASITTSLDDLLVESPYNTYWTASNPAATKGLPPTPITSASDSALAATVSPATGPWLYFVLVDPESGASCFNVEFADHEASKEAGTCTTAAEQSEASGG